MINPTLNLATSDLRAWLALVHVPGFGAQRARAVLTRWGSLELLFTATAELASLQLPAAVLAALQNPPWAAVDADLAWLAAAPDRAIVPLNAPNYPSQLAQLVNAPLVLYIEGDASLLSQPQLAMVGSRNPTPHGLETAKEFAACLAQSGLVITSGLALGIDAASHEGALSRGGQTIAVLGSGLDQLYPASHKALAARIRHQGALVSEFPPYTKAIAANFPRRNRLVSGLSLGTLVVEATLRSGSLITAQMASEQGREVFAIPGSIHNPMARGCHSLIKQGAKLVETAADVLTELAPQLQHYLDQAPDTAKSLNADTLQLDADYQKLLQCMGYEATTVDVLASRMDAPASQVAAMLLILELEGHIARTPIGYLRVKL